MAEKDCGCEIGGDGKFCDDEIAYCPKHAAVDDLIAALEAIKAQKCYCRNWDREEDEPDCPHEIARDAIRKAT